MRTPTRGKGSFMAPIIQSIIKVIVDAHVDSSSPGIIEHRDQPHSPVRYFTQEDINQGKIIYRPPPAAPHLQEIMAFSFDGNAFCLCFQAPKLLSGSSWHTFNKPLFRAP